MIKQITSLSNPTVQHLYKLRTDAQYRKEKATVLVEGIKLIRDLAKSFKFHKIAAKDLHLIPEEINAKELILVTDQLFHKLSSTKHPEGIVAEIDAPKASSLQGTRWLALDGVSDPGNLGSLFRTALAFNWDGIFLLPNCSDPLNDKALRSAKGATFKIPFQKGSLKQLKESLQEKGFTALAADLQGDNPQNFFFEERIALFLGSEGQGLSEEIRQICKPISLPMSSDMESLNVAAAGAIFLYLLQRKVV